MSSDDDDIKQMASAHKNYLAQMIAEQEAALARFQNSTYLSDSHMAAPFGSASLRAGGAGAGAGAHTGAATQRMPSSSAAAAAARNLSGDLSASASPYTFHRAGGAGARSAFAAAPTPGYSRINGVALGGGGRVSPTPSNSSAGSAGVAPNTSIMANARRALAHAAEWGQDVAAGVPAAGHMSSSTHASSPLQQPASSLSADGPTGGAPGSLSQKLSSAALTSELQGKLWSQEHSEWEKRMAELEGRLKRVNNQSLSASQGAAGGASSSAQQAYNVPVVNGRPVQAGVISSDAGTGGGGAKSHNVQTSELVLRLERELGAAVDALVQERKQTTSREALSAARQAELEEEIASRDRKIASLNAKWSSEFEAQGREYSEQLERAFARAQALSGEIEQRDAELLARGGEVKRHVTRLSQQEIELRESTSTVESLRADLDRAGRKNKELELQIQAAEHDKKALLVDMESKARQAAAKFERAHTEWVARLETLRAEMDAKGSKDLREVRRETAEAERRFHEAEQDNFILATEVQKGKDSLDAAQGEIEKLKGLVALEKQNGEAAIRAERDSAELSARSERARMQSLLDEAHAASSELQSRLDSEVRSKAAVSKRVESLEAELRSKSSLISERDLAIHTLKDKLAHQVQALAETESFLSSSTTTITQLRSSHAQLQEELVAVQKKLDSKVASKAEEIKQLEAEMKKMREKARQRSDDLEKAADEARSKQVAAEKRLESFQSEVDSLISQGVSEARSHSEKLECRIEKLQTKLTARAESANAHAVEQDRASSALRAELDRRGHAEELAARQLHDMETRFKAERARATQLEAKLNHVVAVAPDGLAHQRALQELTAAKQVAANIQARFRELQAKFERQSVRQTALQNLLQRLQDEQQHQQFRVPARNYLSAPALPLYTPLDSHAPNTLLDGRTAYGGSSLAGFSGAGAGAGAGTNFSPEEEEMYRVLLREQEARSGRRARAHASAYGVGGGGGADQSATSDSDGGLYDHARGHVSSRGTLSSHLRSRSAPRSSPRGSRSDAARRTKDDADVNLNLQVNFDPRVLAKFRELDLLPGGSPRSGNGAQLASCGHAHRLHDERACKICQRRAFGRGLECSTHYAPSQHLVRQSPTKTYNQAKMPHA